MKLMESKKDYIVIAHQKIRTILPYGDVRYVPMRNRTSVELAAPNEPQMLSSYMIRKCSQSIIDYWWGNYEPIEDEF